MKGVEPSEQFIMYAKLLLIRSIQVNIGHITTGTIIIIFIIISSHTQYISTIKLLSTMLGASQKNIVELAWKWCEIYWYMYSMRQHRRLQIKSFNMSVGVKRIPLFIAYIKTTQMGPVGGNICTDWSLIPCCDNKIFLAVLYLTGKCRNGNVHTLLFYK